MNIKSYFRYVWFIVCKAWKTGARRAILEILAARELHRRALGYRLAVFEGCLVGVAFALISLFLLFLIRWL